MTDNLSPEAVAKMADEFDLCAELSVSRSNGDYRETAATLRALSAKLADAERKLEASRQIERNVQEAREFEFRRAEAAEAKLAEVTAERDALTGILTRSSDQIRNLARAEAAEAKLAEVTAERDRYKMACDSQGKVVVDVAGTIDRISPAQMEAMSAILLNQMILASEACDEAAEAAAAESEGSLAHALHQLDAAKARATELEALVKAYEDGTVPNLTAVYLAGGKDMADKLKAAEALARDPKHAAEVLLGSDDLTIKPAAKALQDAFGLSGVGWKQYLKAFRAALRALAGDTP